MATGDLSRIRHLEGQLCINPTDLSTAFPHGGTAIGEYTRMRFNAREQFEGIATEAYGGSLIAKPYVGCRPIIRAVLRDWDPDALGKIHPNTTLASTGERSIDMNASQSGKNRGGYSPSPFILCFSPYDLENSQMVLFYRAVACPDEAEEINLSLAEEAGLGVAFEALVDATGRLGRAGIREILAL